MKDLLKILLSGLLVFMVLAITQEREIFFPGGGKPAADALDGEQEKAAVTAVRQTLALFAHFYASGGDERFADRMPASGAVREEMTADIRYLRANHRRQEPTLQRFEVRSVKRLREGTVEVRTREFWIHRFFWVGKPAESEPPRSQIIYGNYLVAQQAQSWRVEGWEFAQPEDASGSKAGR